MRKFFGSMGSVGRVTIESQALKTNMLGDPSVRVVDVYEPAGYEGQGLPLLVDLVGFTGSGLSHTNWAGFRENLPERLDRLIGEQRMPPVVVAFPDCFTRLGGNQYINYINSASMGAWDDIGSVRAPFRGSCGRPIGWSRLPSTPKKTNNDVC